jgi:hypothetical protein
MGLAGALLANAVLLGVLAGFALLNETQPDLYYQSVQEDEWLEWASFWAFLLAAGVFAVGAVRQREADGGWPWFLAGLALFCLVVALEEISWGQRVLGYRPPTYFLEHNYQQELNLHNVIERDLRKLGAKAVILGYGVALPLLALIPPLGRLLSRWAVVAPPPELIPGFAAAYWTYEAYPFKYSGEIMELMLGLGFLFAGLARARELRFGGAAAGLRRALPASLALSAALVFGLGLANAHASRAQRSASLENLKRARVEIAALERDFLARNRNPSGWSPSRCGIHKRLYAFVRKYQGTFLRRGEFAALESRGMPGERVEFFLDPWNSPYWLRDKCSASRRVVFVYSFGPNRRRESSPWEIRGDDVGAVLVRGKRKVPGADPP